MSSPLFVLAASSTEASEWRHSIWQQMLSATIPQKYSKTFFNEAVFDNEAWPDGRAKYVPNGLRMVETLLLREYSEDDVVVCYVDQLERFVGPETIIARHLVFARSRAVAAAVVSSVRPRQKSGVHFRSNTSSLVRK